MRDEATFRDPARPPIGIAHVLVAGVDDTAHDGPEEVTDARVAGWIRAFGIAAPGPLHAVLAKLAA